MAKTGIEPLAVLQLLCNDLEAWAEAYPGPKGKVSLAGDPGDIVEALFDAPSSCRIVLHWAGDEAANKVPEVQLVDATIEVWLIKKAGLRKLPGSDLTEGGYLQLLSDVRSRVRSCVMPSDMGRPYMVYKSCEALSPDYSREIPATGWRMRFELRGALPDMEVRP